MVIKNKDGTIYKLNKPNPLVKDQEFLSENIVFHNFDWESFSLDKKTTKKTISPEKPKEEIVEIKKQEIKQEPIKEIKPEPEPEKEEEIEEPEKKKNIALIYCLPYGEVKVKDEFYDETYKKIQYGNKFLFEGIMIEWSDMQFVFWTNAKLTNKSIVYASKYKNGPDISMMRWWKINNIEQQNENSFIYYCFPSIDQPSFN